MLGSKDKDNMKDSGKNDIAKRESGGKNNLGTPYLLVNVLVHHTLKDDKNYTKYLVS
jgi:hypothetical protein